MALNMRVDENLDKQMDEETVLKPDTISHVLSKAGAVRCIRMPPCFLAILQKRNYFCNFFSASHDLSKMKSTHKRKKLLLGEKILFILC